MMIDVARVVDWIAVGITLVGIGARQQYLKGKTEQRLKEATNAMDDHEERMRRLEMGRSDNSAQIQVLRESHKAIVERLDDLKEMLRDHIKINGK